MPTNRVIPFVDAGSGGRAFVAVRVQGEVVGLALSLKSEGDLEVFLGRDELAVLMGALKQAAAEINQPPSTA